MRLAGIIAEFDPFHNGHRYLLEKAADECGLTLCVMSGNAVQRGALALFPEETRVKAALLNRADLIVQLPVDWSLAGAEQFARGGMTLLQSFGVTDVFVGVRDARAEQIEQIAAYLDSDEYTASLRLRLSSQHTLASVRAELVAERFGLDPAYLSDGNQTLAVEYVKAARRSDYHPTFHFVPRQQADHNSGLAGQTICSGSLLRERFRQGLSYRAFVPSSVHALYEATPYSNDANVHTAMLLQLRRTPLSLLRSLPDCSEGLDNRLFHAIQRAGNYGELWEQLNTKRYPDARLRRLLLAAVIGLDRSTLKQNPPYRRVLGCSQRGRDLLRQETSDPTVPLLISGTDYNRLNDHAKQVLSHQQALDNLYALSLNVATPPADVTRNRLIVM